MRSSMIVAPLLICTSFASDLKLTGDSSSIIFNKDAIVKASCVGETPAVKGIVGPKENDAYPTKVVLELLHVPPSCANLEVTTPCASHNELSTPPLFKCVMSGDSDQHSTDFVHAYPKNIESDGVFFGVATHVACPMPDMDVYKRISGHEDGSSAPKSITIAVTHLNEELPYRGLDGGATITLTIPAPPPPPPPLPLTPPPPPLDTCGGFDNQLKIGDDCWYMGRNGQSCATICSAVSRAFDPSATQHTGHVICQQMYDAGVHVKSGNSAVHPDQWNVWNSNWVANACCGAENGNWGSTGNMPSSTWTHTQCNIPCVCK